MPKLTKDKATGIPILDEFAYGRWPHAFMIWATRHSVPDHFLITLMYLWDATVGSSDDYSGDLAIAQVPVRERTVRKWLAAFCAVGFFEEKKRKPGDKKGSIFVYESSTTPSAWERMFKVAGLAERFGNWDSMPPDKFGKFIARAAGADVPFSQAEQEFRTKTFSQAEQQEIRTKAKAILAGK